MQKQPLRIFISHSSRDLPFTEKLAQDLRGTLKDSEWVWYDTSNLSGGESWWPTILAKLNQSNVCLLVCSPEAMKSPWVNDEINIAWRLRNKNQFFRLIPLLYQPCDLRPDLDTLHYINFLKPISYTEAFQRLLMTLGVESAVYKESQEHAAIASNDAHEGQIKLEQVERKPGTAEFFLQRFSRRTVWGTVALIGLAAVTASLWESRQLFTPASVSPSTSLSRTPSVLSSPTPTGSARLETDAHIFSLTVDADGLLNNSSQAINAVKQQVNNQTILQGRSVGMTTVYAGAPMDADIARALDVAKKIYDILHTLGQEGFAFQKSAYDEPLYLLGEDLTYIKVKVYLFTK